MKINWKKFKLPESKGNFGFVSRPDLFEEWQTRKWAFISKLNKLQKETMFLSSIPTRKDNSLYAEIFDDCKKNPEECLHWLINSLLHNHGWNSITLIHEILGKELPYNPEHAGKFTWQVIDILTWYAKKLEEDDER